MEQTNNNCVRFPIQINHHSFQFIDPQSIGLPNQIKGLKISEISWNNFNGKIHKSSPYAAHIFWYIQYEYSKCQKQSKNIVSVKVKISPKSWAVKQKTNPQLLMHEYGHYLIGCICGLTFQKRVNQQYRQPLTFSFDEWCRGIFNDTLNEFLKIQKQYDEETDHRLNITIQQQWQNNIINTLKQFSLENQLIGFRSKKKNTKDYVQINQNSNIYNQKVDSQTKDEFVKREQKQFSIHKLKRFSRNKIKVEENIQKRKIKSKA